MQNPSRKPIDIAKPPFACPTYNGNQAIKGASEPRSTHSRVFWQQIRQTPFQQLLEPSAQVKPFDQQFCSTSPKPGSPRKHSSGASPRADSLTNDSPNRSPQTSSPYQQPSGSSLSQQPFESSVQAKPRPTAPGTSPQASPSYQQPFRPSDRPRPLTNTPPSHRPDAEGPCDAAPYCACATPSPSGAPTGQGPLPLCAQHHPSSIRS